MAKKAVSTLTKRHRAIARGREGYVTFNQQQNMKTHLRKIGYKGGFDLPPKKKK